MSDAPQGSSRPERKRPSYGLPGPVPDPRAAQPDAAETAPATPAPAPPIEAASAPAAHPRRRRGLTPLVIGLVLLLVVAPALFLGGIVWSMTVLVQEVGGEPAPLVGGSAQVELGAKEMIVVYVPAADAAGATCTAMGEALTSVPSSGSVQLADGEAYEQELGVVALEDTTATVSCTGTEAPVSIGPVRLFDVAGPLLIGPVLGIITGLIGLVTAIVGLILLLRSRRS